MIKISKLKQHNVPFLAENIGFRIMLMVQCLVAGWMVSLCQPLRLPSLFSTCKKLIHFYVNIPVFKMCLYYNVMSFVYSEYLHYIWQIVTEWLYFNLPQWCYTRALWGAPDCIKCRFLHHFALHFFFLKCPQWSLYLLFLDTWCGWSSSAEHLDQQCDQMARLF